MTQHVCSTGLRGRAMIAWPTPGDFTFQWDITSYTTNSFCFLCYPYTVKTSVKPAALWAMATLQFSHKRKTEGRWV